MDFFEALRLWREKGEPMKNLRVKSIGAKIDSRPFAKPNPAQEKFVSDFEDYTKALEHQMLMSMGVPAHLIGGQSLYGSYREACYF